MRRTRVALACLAVAALGCGSLFAAGQGEGQTKPTSAKRVVTTITRPTYATAEWFNNMNAAFTAETGIDVDVQVTPGTDKEHLAKVNIDLLAGGKVDVVSTLGSRELNARLEAGFFAPLSKKVAAAGVDANAVWGKYIVRDETEEYYSIPNKQEIYCLYYNKNMFDKAGIPYPKAPWTWNDYVETARKLTNPSANTYGALMRVEIPAVIIQAMQKKVPLYKKDGTSNFDDPAFAESLKWYYEMGNVKKYIMSVRELLAEKASWNYWATVDNQAMFIQGNWFMRLLNSPKDYPRDWKYGIVAIPTSGTAAGANNFISMSYASVNKNAAHPAEALEYVIWLGKNQWKFEKGIPALVNLTPAQQAEVFQSTADASGGQITVADLNKALIDNGMGVINTDIAGPKAAQYTQIITEEVERYCLDQQDLPTTVSRIKSRADEALKQQ